jgi:hypothetical protein
MWHPSCYSCYTPGHKLYSFVFSIFNFSAGNIQCVSFDWMNIFRFYMSMYIVIAKYLGSVLLKVYLFEIPVYFCENFESSVYISSLTCGVSLCRVHQNGFTRIHRVILKCDFNDRCDS